ncbi:MAG: hypothetical protein Solivirus1_48 [Solivirus sp.]|uniref:Uncharacterized protein n=1 Tax=Solivirus sp. TaxID=2487772 RepID=A0A3G5AHW3_9VIRU|nr:MAG: hypothetical protein Solivirus1_48 [Solivirus sp.]
MTLFRPPAFGDFISFNYEEKEYSALVSGMKESYLMAHVIHNNEFCQLEALLLWNGEKWFFANGKEATPKFYFGNAPFYKSKPVFEENSSPIPLLVYNPVVISENGNLQGHSPSILEDPQTLSSEEEESDEETTESTEESSSASEDSEDFDSESSEETDPDEYESEEEEESD